jgi:hypothetical protein
MESRRHLELGMHIYRLRELRGAEMMSAAILLAAVGEQTKIPSGSPDHGNADTPSFASSLAKQFKDSGLMQTETSFVSSQPASKNVPGETETKKSEEVGEMPTGLKTGSSGIETGVAVEGPKIATSEKAATQPLKTAVAQSVRNVEGKSSVDEKDSESTQISDRSDLPSVPAASDGFAAAPAEASSPRVELSENKPTSGSPAGTFGITQKVVAQLGLAKETVSTGIAKADKAESTQKKSPKDVKSDVVGKPSNAGVNMGNVAGGIASVAAATPAAGDAPNYSGKAVALDPVELLPITERSGAGAVPMTAGGTVRPEAVVGKMGLSAVGQMPTGQDVANGSPKAATEAEKVNAPSVQASDGDGLPKSEPGSAVAPGPSAVAAVEGVVSGATGLVAAGSPLRDLVIAKVPGEEASVASSTVRVPLSEQPGAGMMTMPMDSAPRMLSATPNALEVGIQNGTNGWVRVRAEMTDGGSVNASVSAASPQGQEMLHRELPSLTAYLQQEKVTVNSVVVHVPVQAAVEARGSAGSDGGNDQMAQRGSEGGGQRQSGEGLSANEPERAMKYRTPSVDEDGLPQLDAHSVGGGWLSVRA